MHTHTDMHMHSCTDAHLTHCIHFSLIVLASLSSRFTVSFFFLLLSEQGITAADCDSFKHCIHWSRKACYSHFGWLLLFLFLFWRAVNKLNVAAVFHYLFMSDFHLLFLMVIWWVRSVTAASCI